MTILTKIVRILGWTWIVASILVIIVGLAMTLFKEGLGALWDTLSSQNVANSIGLVLALAPGLVLLQLAEAIQQRRRGKCIATLVALPVTVGIVIIMIGIAIRSEVNIKDEKWADSIHVKDRPWRTHFCSDYLITSVCSVSEEMRADGPNKLPDVIHVGDVIASTDKGGKEFTFTVRNISLFTFTKDLDSVYGGERYTAKKGDTICTLYDERSRSRIVRNEGTRLSRIIVKNCQEVASPEKTASTTKADLKVAFAQYETVVGVFPKEFLRFSIIEQEAYVRGALDGEYFLLEENKHPDRDGFVSCLNAYLKTILSQAKSFVEREGEQKLLMPWTLSRLVGKTCPKETRMPLENSPEYAEAATFVKLIAKKPSDVVYSEEQRHAIDKAFIRGVLDGKVFGLYGHDYHKLVAYLECLSKPGSLDTIFRSMRISQEFGQNLHKSQAYNVVQGEAIVCEELNKK